MFDHLELSYFKHTQAPAVKMLLRNKITGVHVFISLSVCLWAELHQNHWKDLDKIVLDNVAYF